MPQDSSRDGRQGAGAATAERPRTASCPRGERIERTPAGAELWRVDLRAAGDALEAMEAAAARLARDEVEWIAVTRDAEVRRERRTAHIALRVLIERMFGQRWRAVPYKRSPTGKPSLAGTEAAFSLSHVEGIALIGLAPRGTIGVDVERLRPIKASDERSAKIEAAAEVVAPMTPLPEDEPARFLQAWVRLEAVAKAEGCGIGPLLTRLGVAPSARNGPGTVWLAEPLGVHDLSVNDDLVAAVAMTAGQPLPVVRPFPSAAAGLEALLEPGTVDR